MQDNAATPVTSEASEAEGDEPPPADPFDSTIIGPVCAACACILVPDASRRKHCLTALCPLPQWMDLWDLEKDAKGRPNKHISKYLSTDPASRDPDRYITKNQW